MKLRLLTLLCLGVVLAAVNTGLYQHRFEFGDELLPPIPDTVDGGGWTFSDKGSIEITGERSATLERVQNAPALSCGIASFEEFRYVLASSRMKTENATQGASNYHLARVIFYGRDENNTKLWKYPHLLMSQSDTSDWRKREAVFEIYPEMDKIEFGVQMLATEGKMFVGDLSLRPAFEKGYYKFARAACALAWLAWIFFLFHSLSAGGSAPVLLSLNALIIAATFLVTVFPGVNRSIQPLLPEGFADSPDAVAVATPAAPPRTMGNPDAPPAKSNEIPPVDPPVKPRPPALAQSEEVPGPTPPSKRISPWKFIYPHQNFFHILVFGASVLGSCLCTRKPMVVAVVYTVFALAAELVQTIETERLNPGDLLDIAFNVLGIAVGILAWRILKGWMAKRSRISATG